MSGKQTKKRTCTILIAPLLLLAALCCTTGCRDTDVLKQIIYDQSASTVDYNNPSKVYINDSNSKTKSNLVSSKEVEKNAAETKEKQNLVVYSSKPNSPGYTAKQSTYSKTPDFSGLEASKGVSFYKSNDKDAVERKSSSEEKKQSTASQSQTSQGSGTSSQAGTTSSNEGNPSTTKSGDGGGTGGSVTVSDATGNLSDPPKVNRIAAFGQAAVIVQMVGGKGALVAADKTLLAGNFKTVFSDEGSASIKQAWSDSGSAAKMDVDAIIASKADTVLVYSSDYADKLSSQDKKKLNAAGIFLTVIPSLTSSTYIEKAVNTVGDMLSESTVIGNKGRTEDIASEYADFQDKLITSCINANGGKLASYGSETYESGNKSKYSYNADADYTLLVDGFDSTASYINSSYGTLPKDKGVALATLGWSSSPVSFYIQAGGLINNAAAKSSDIDSGQTAVWQFNTVDAPIEKAAKYWTYSKTGAFAAIPSGNLSINRTQGWNGVLLTNPDSSSSEPGASFGTAAFSTIIATSQSIKSAIITSSKDSNGLYHPYDTKASLGGASVFERTGAQGNMIRSCIGVDGTSSATTNAFSKGYITDSSIVVNPSGLFSSWVSGSVESFLEAAWVNDDVNDNGTKVGIKSEIENFYEQFYRYDLTSAQVNDIIAGK